MRYIFEINRRVVFELKSIGWRIISYDVFLLYYEHAPRTGWNRMEGTQKQYCTLSSL